MLRKSITILTIVAALACSVVFANAAHKPQKIQKVTVNLTERGYKPSNFRLKKGVRAYLTFIRRTDATCGQVLVIPAYGIRRDLPLNEPVTVKFTPKRTGTFNFTCGMKMLRGQIIVN